MTDYIKREAVINLIDGMQQSFQISKSTQYTIDKRIAEISSADVVEVGKRYYTTEYQVTVTNETNEIEGKHGHRLLAPGSSYFVIERIDND